MKLKKRLRLTLDEIEKEMEILTDEEQEQARGGRDYIPPLSGYEMPLVNLGSTGIITGEIHFPSQMGGSTGSSGNTSVSGSNTTQQSNCKDSCVFDVFDYLDGSSYDACHYYDNLKQEWGIEPLPNGGIPTDCIPYVGEYGGFKVTELPQTFMANPRGTIGGNKIIAVIPTASGIGHAVIVREINNGIVKYADPTNKIIGYINQNQCSFYSIEH